MFEYKPYIFAIAAIFLALASGILIGITFGEDVVVSNQKEMIEFMERQLTDLQEKLAEGKKELERWQDLAPLVLKGFEGSLTGNKILLLAAGAPPPAEVLNLFHGSGAEFVLVELPGQAPPPGLKMDEQSAHLLAGKLTGEPEGVNLADEGCRIWGEISDRPDLILLSFHSEPALPGELFLKLLGEELLQAGNRVFALYQEKKEEGLSLSPEAAIVENLNTFWGKLALMEILQEPGKNSCPAGGEGGCPWK